MFHSTHSSFARTGLLAAVLLLPIPTDGLAAPVLYEFNGACVSLQGDGCSAFGISDGTAVTGTLSFDGSLVVPNDRLILNPSTVDFELSVEFGNFEVSTETVLGGFGSPFEVFFLPPSGSELYPGSGPIPFDILTDGSKYLLLGAGRVEANQVFAIFRNVAEARGSWVIGTSAVPEPASIELLLLGLGGARIAQRRYRR